MLTVNAYLNFNGNTEEAFNFYKSVFGGEFTMMQKFKDTPEGAKVPAAEADKILHISLPVGKNGHLMASDYVPSMGIPPFVSGNNFSLSINAESRAEGDQIFKNLSKGGKVTMPMQDTFWGSYFGMLVDKFGIQWMMSVENN